MLKDFVTIHIPKTLPFDNWPSPVLEIESDSRTYVWGKKFIEIAAQVEHLCDWGRVEIDANGLIYGVCWDHGGPEKRLTPVPWDGPC